MNELYRYNNKIKELGYFFKNHKIIMNNVSFYKSKTEVRKYKKIAIYIL